MRISCAGALVPEHIDVAVLGAGPAGAAAAVALRAHGRSVALVDQARSSPTIGEALPPEATLLLQELGVWNTFVAAGHAPAVCNEAAWGSTVINATSFISSPHGRGWHLDRPAFDAMLRQRARDVGAEAIEGRVRHVTRGQSWQLTVESDEGQRTVDAKWIVDATGRTSWLAAQLGVRRLQVGQLTATAVMFERAVGEPDHDRTTLVESAPHGWFYTAPLPSSRRIAVCFTRPASAPRTLGQFAEAIEVTMHVRARLTGYRTTAGPWLFAANSSLLQRGSGSGWIAVGDAACAYDPVSSYGLVSALGTGLKAGGAIDEALAGNTAAVTTYEWHLRRHFDRYLKALEEVYAMERRWPESPFWRR